MTNIGFIYIYIYIYNPISWWGFPKCQVYIKKNWITQGSSTTFGLIPNLEVQPYLFGGMANDTIKGHL